MPTQLGLVRSAVNRYFDPPVSPVGGESTRVIADIADEARPNQLSSSSTATDSTDR